MSLLKNTADLKCPSCGYEFPLLLRIFINTARGHECPRCGSVLVQSKASIAMQYFLLLLSLIFIVSFISKYFDSEGGWIYFLFWVVTFLLLVVIKLGSDLSVSCDPRKNSEESNQDSST
jgi:predicted RNA-binding Zn-ribbon protein involved in translation (DUF1610 family)